MEKSDALTHFWRASSHHLVFGTILPERRHAALEWLGRSAATSSTQDDHKAIASAFEGSITEVLRLVASGAATLSELKAPLVRSLVPLVRSPLASSMDETLRRLLTFALDLKGDAITGYQVSYEGVVRNVEVKESQVEEIAEGEVLKALHGEKPDSEWQTPVRLSVQVPVASDDQLIHLPVAVDLAQLFLRENVDVQAAVGRALASHFLKADAGLGRWLGETTDGLARSTEIERKGARQAFAVKYLASHYYAFTRHPKDTLLGLASGPLVMVDQLIGFDRLGAFKDTKELLLEFFKSVTPDDDAALSLAALLLRTPEALEAHVHQLATSFEDFKAEEGVTRARLLGGIATRVFAERRPFQRLWLLSVLLGLAERHPRWKLGDAKRNLSLGAWARRTVLHFIRPESGEHREAETRAIYLLALRMSTAAVLTPGHLGEALAHTGDHDEAVGCALIRSIALADHITTMLYDILTPDRVGLAKDVFGKLGLQPMAELFPDIFNPYLYDVGGFDPIEVGLIRLLDILVAAKPSLRRMPTWWSTKLAEALKSIALRRPSDGDTTFLKGKNESKPNRLGLVLDTTAQDAASRLLKQVGAEGA